MSLVARVQLSIVVLSTGYSPFCTVVLLVICIALSEVNIESVLAIQLRVTCTSKVSPLSALTGLDIDTLEISSAFKSALTGIAISVHMASSQAK